MISEADIMKLNLMLRLKERLIRLSQRNLLRLLAGVGPEEEEGVKG